MKCKCCDGKDICVLLNFGLQPPSNRFVSIGESCYDTHPLRFGQCNTCSLFQLIDPMVLPMVRSRHPWLVYNEPEGHLDTLVQYLIDLYNITPSSRIVGLTYKDDSTLVRFNRLGYKNTLRYDLNYDLGINNPCAGLETIQSVINDAAVERLIGRYGKADLLIVRHVLEHSHEPAKFLNSLEQILAPGGRIILEMPDCRKFIEACDYSFIWEEHITYFSPRTLDIFLTYNGYCGESLVYPYPLEDSLIAIVEPSVNTASVVKDDSLASELASGVWFASNFESERMRYKAQFSARKKSGQKIAIFGASHLAVKFLNLFELKDYVDAVIDDNPNKQGLAMPGSGVPIIDSSELLNFDLCMLSLNPESEKKVLEKHKAYLQGGGQFASIFSLSSLALRSYSVPIQVVEFLKFHHDL